MHHLQEKKYQSFKGNFYNTTIIDSIYLEGYVVEEIEKNMSDAQKIKFVYDTFLSEVGEWNIPQVGQIKSLEYWLSGLPSVMNIPFKNHEILQNYESYRKTNGGFRLETERSEDNFLSSYFNNLAKALSNLKNL